MEIAHQRVQLASVFVHTVAAVSPYPFGMFFLKRRAQYPTAASLLKRLGRSTLLGWKQRKHRSPRWHFGASVSNLQNISDDFHQCSQGFVLEPDQSKSVQCYAKSIAVRYARA